MGAFWCHLVVQRGPLWGACSLNCITRVPAVSLDGVGVSLFCKAISTSSWKWWDKTGHKHLELLPWLYWDNIVLWYFCRFTKSYASYGHVLMFQDLITWEQWSFLPVVKLWLMFSKHFESHRMLSGYYVYLLVYLIKNNTHPLCFLQEVIFCVCV